MQANQEFIRSFNLPMAALSAAIAWFVLYGSYFANGYWIDGQGYILGRDFVNFWHYGIAAWSGQGASFYDLVTYNEVLDRLIPGYDYPDQNFSYPPHYMLIAAPFGLVGYNWALAIYTAIGLGLYWLVVARPFPDRASRVALFAMPTLTVYLLCGQVSAFIAVLLVCVYRWLDERPVLAAALIALLTVKPQLGLLIPVFLLATGRYRVFACAAAFTILLLGLSVAIFGIEVWRTYLEIGVANQSKSLVDSNAIVMGLMPTAFVNTILAGGGATAATAMQVISALLGIGLLIAVIRRTRDEFLRFCALLGATFLVTPYLMAYDTLVLGWAMLGLAVRFEMDAFDRIAYRLAMIVCPLGVSLALSGLPGAPLALALPAVWIGKCALRPSRSRAEVVPAAFSSPAQ